MNEEKKWVWGSVYVGGPARTTINHIVVEIKREESKSIKDEG